LIRDAARVASTWKLSPLVGASNVSLFMIVFPAITP
jgi:hypothetical protein